MKNNIKFLLLSLLVVLYSCDSELDINEDPNTPQEIDAGLALSAVEGSLVTVMGGELFNLGGIYAQYYTQSPGASQYENIDTYNINVDYANRLWTELYAGALNDAKFVLDRSEEDGETGTYLIATCLQAYTYQILTDIFGDIPYTEALEGPNNLSPMPTSGEEIYLDLIAKIDSALAQYEQNPVESSVGGQDLIYSADMESWVQFANTLKLKLYMRMAYTSQSNSSEVMNLIAEGNFITSDVNFDENIDGQKIFADASDKRNPFYEVQIQYLGDVNNVASNSLIEYLKSNNDSRYTAIYKPNGDGDYIGIDQGDGITSNFSNQTATDFARPRVTPTTPVYLMTVAESQFLQAEALARYSGASQAQAAYNQGVQESFVLHNLDVTEAQSLTDVGGAYEFDTTGSTEELVEQIIIQKWVALAGVNNIEAWIETTRTKFPELVSTTPDYSLGRRLVSVTSVLPGNSIPASIFYADNEVIRNSNLNQKENLLVKVWWDQK